MAVIPGIGARGAEDAKDNREKGREDSAVTAKVPGKCAALATDIPELMISPPSAATALSHAALALPFAASSRSFAVNDTHLAAIDLPGVRLSQQTAAMFLPVLFPGVADAAYDTPDEARSAPDGWKARLVAALETTYAINEHFFATYDGHTAASE
jgi:hypothetical protein